MTTMILSFPRKRESILGVARYLCQHGFVGSIKGIFMACILTMTQLAYAGGMADEGMPQPYDGIYVGANVGVATLLDGQSIIVTPMQNHVGNLGLVAGGLIGYDYSLTDVFKIGVEGFGNANNLNTSIHNESANTTYQVSSTYNAGLRLLPGLTFYPGSVFHVIVGFSSTTFNLQDNGVFGYLNTSVNKTGFQTGLGLTSTVFQNLVIRLDGLYTTYISQSNRGITLSNPNQYQYYTNDLSTLESDVSLVYKFNI